MSHATRSQGSQATPSGSVANRSSNKTRKRKLSVLDDSTVSSAPRLPSIVYHNDSEESIPAKPDTLSPLPSSPSPSSSSQSRAAVAPVASAESIAKLQYQPSGLPPLRKYHSLDEVREAFAAELDYQDHARDELAELVLRHSDGGFYNTKVPELYLLCGPASTGKTTAAELVVHLRYQKKLTQRMLRKVYLRVGCNEFGTGVRKFLDTIADALLEMDPDADKVLFLDEFGPPNNSVQFMKQMFTFFDTGILRSQSFTPLTIIIATNVGKECIYTQHRTVYQQLCASCTQLSTTIPHHYESPGGAKHADDACCCTLTSVDDPRSPSPFSLSPSSESDDAASESPIVETSQSNSSIDRTGFGCNAHICMNADTPVPKVGCCNPTGHWGHFLQHHLLPIIQSTLCFYADHIYSRIAQHICCFFPYTGSQRLSVLCKQFTYIAKDIYHQTGIPVTFHPTCADAMTKAPTAEFSRTLAAQLRDAALTALTLARDSLDSKANMIVLAINDRISLLAAGTHYGNMGRLSTAFHVLEFPRLQMQAIAATMMEESLQNQMDVEHKEDDTPTSNVAPIDMANFPILESARVCGLLWYATVREGCLGPVLRRFTSTTYTFNESDFLGWGIFECCKLMFTGNVTPFSKLYPYAQQLRSTFINQSKDESTSSPKSASEPATTAAKSKRTRRTRTSTIERNTATVEHDKSYHKLLMQVLNSGADEHELIGLLVVLLSLFSFIFDSEAPSSDTEATLVLLDQPVQVWTPCTDDDDRFLSSLVDDNNHQFQAVRTFVLLLVRSLYTMYSIVKRHELERFNYQASEILKAMESMVDIFNCRLDEPALLSKHVWKLKNRPIGSALSETEAADLHFYRLVSYAFDQPLFDDEDNEEIGLRALVPRFPAITHTSTTQNQTRVKMQQTFFMKQVVVGMDTAEDALEDSASDIQSISENEDEDHDSSGEAEDSDASSSEEEGRDDHSSSSRGRPAPHQQKQVHSTVLTCKHCRSKQYTIPANSTSVRKRQLENNFRKHQSTCHHNPSNKNKSKLRTPSSTSSARKR